MAYFTQSDIQEYTGFASMDFKNAGSVMTATQWATLCTHIVDYVSDLVNKYCGVATFESHSVIEYHDSPGAQSDDETWLEEDSRVYLWEPCISVGTVSVDINADTATQYWDARTVRSTAASGDYSVATRGDLTWIRFHNRSPIEGHDNIKIEYTGGYSADSQQLRLLKWICLRIAKNMLLEMKKTQEVSTIRQTAVRNYAEMFEPKIEQVILTEDIVRDLWKFKRLRLGGPTWY